MDTERALSDARARRWWQRGRPVRSLGRAAAFVDDVGYALLFGLRDRSMPSLHDATREHGASLGGLDGWGPDAERIWAWKDELPKRGLAWYGRFVRGRQSFLGPSLLRDLYPREGEPDDFRDLRLGGDAARIAEILLLNGPTSAAILREATGAFGPKGRTRFDRAVSELGRALVVTNFGVEEQPAGWPSSVFELTARVFDVVGQDRDPETAALRVARRYLDTMIRARPYELGNAFGWRADAARRAFESLVDRGEASRAGPAYRLSQAEPGASRVTSA